MDFRFLLLYASVSPRFETGTLDGPRVIATEAAHHRRARFTTRRIVVSVSSRSPGPICRRLLSPGFGGSGDLGTEIRALLLKTTGSHWLVLKGRMTFRL